MEYSADYKSALAVVVPACCCGFVIHNSAFCRDAIVGVSTLCWSYLKPPDKELTYLEKIKKIIRLDIIVIKVFLCKFAN